MIPEHLLDVLPALPEPSFLVAGHGPVVGANAAGAALVHRRPAELHDIPLASLTLDPPERVARYLGACSRSRSTVLGALSFTDTSGKPHRCRCQGAVVRPASVGEHAIVLLRFAPIERTTRDFVLLDRKIEQLSREIRIRQHVEAERAELLAEARERQRRLAAQAEELERARRRVERLQTVTAALSGALTPEQVATVVVEQGRAALDARTAAIYRLNDRTATLQLVRAVGYPPGSIDAWESVPVNAPYPLPEAVRTGTSVFIESEADWHARFAGHTWISGEDDSRSWAALPLAIDGRMLGVLGLRFTTREPFSADERSFMIALAQQCAQALERARLYVEARAANAAKSEFLAVMSHELRTPLNAIAGYAQLLEMEVHGPVTPAQREALTRLRRGQRRLLSLVNDVLNLARIESGAARFDLRSVVLDDILVELEALIAPQVAQRGVHYEYRRVDRAVKARVDPDRLQQIVLNLLSNAVKFTERGGHITLECIPSASTVAIRVTDTGCGIPAAKLDSIFEPFVQVDTGLTRPAEGTGLGLAISRDLARAMGGELTAESVLGEGATFTLTLRRDESRTASAVESAGQTMEHGAPAKAR